uniref:LanC-like protein n=1 Tax=Tamarix hispida TaxID=189793 RepID=A0A9E8DES3_9CARY|nr:LanC-like protein [Tamarix hispida]
MSSVINISSSAHSRSSSGGRKDSHRSHRHEGDNRDEERDLFDLLVDHGNIKVANNLIPDHDAFLKAAISLKDEVVEVTLKGWEEGSTDPTSYVGVLGTAFTAFRSYQLTGSRQDLRLSADIVDTCALIARNSRHVTFLCGRGGVYSLGAVIYSYVGDHQRRDQYLNMFLELAGEKALPVGPEDGGCGMSYDLMYGRAGFLWAALFVKSHLGPDSVPNDVLMLVVEAVLSGGRAGASDISHACPLMYRWHGTRYLGAANGLAGILHVLLHFPLSEEDTADVKGTLRYMMHNRFPHSGNYPSSVGSVRDKLVQWSHGATSMAITLSKASQVFQNEREFRDAAIEAGEVVWKNGLLKKVGLADGTAGNAYAFLSLYKLTGESIYEERAKAFASFLYHNAREIVNVGISGNGVVDRAYSLFLGLAGVSCLWFDILCPEQSKFPGYEL